MHGNSIKITVHWCVRTPVIIQFGVSYLQTGVGAKVGADYVNRIAPIFFAEYIQLDVVILNRQQYSRVSRFGFQSFSLNVSIAFNPALFYTNHK